MKKEFLDLDRQPIANKFLREDEFEDEFLYNLKVVFDDNTKLVSLKVFLIQLSKFAAPGRCLT